MEYSLLLESLLYYSPRFREILSKIKHPIAFNILDMEGKNIDPDLTFIDIDGKGVITFSQMDKVERSMKSRYKEIGLSDEDFELDTQFERGIADDIFDNDQGEGDETKKFIYVSNRNTIRLGRLIKKIFGNLYSDSDIENFVNLLKSAMDSKPHFELWSGKQIYDAYLTENYLKRGGTLGSSCMNNKNYVGLYVENPEVCSVLVLKDVDKILGRALVWKLNTCQRQKPIISNNILTISRGSSINVEYFMDRVYTSDDFHVETFRKYAREKGWAYRTYNSFHDRDEMTFKDEEISVKMTVKLKKCDMKIFPYADTFGRLDVNSKILYNDTNIDKVGHILTSTGGGYSSKNYPKTNSIIRKFKDFFS
jgi:hypothetical protein